MKKIKIKHIIKKSSLELIYYTLGNWLDLKEDLLLCVCMAMLV